MHYMVHVELARRLAADKTRRPSSAAAPVSHPRHDRRHSLGTDVATQARGLQFHLDARLGSASRDPMNDRWAPHCGQWV
jgi:hypothetical protein